MPRRVLLYPGLVRTMRQVRLALQQSMSSAERAKWARQGERGLGDLSGGARGARPAPAGARPAPTNGRAHRSS